MKTKKLATLSTLAGGVLLILALFRGTVSQFLLILYVCLWAIVWLIHWMRAPGRSLPAQPSRLKRWLDGESDSDVPEETAYDIGGTLLQHVEARITEQLQNVFPQAEWHWCEEDPETLILDGGTAWLRTRNTGAYRNATLSFEEPDNLHLELVQTTPLKTLRVDPPVSAEKSEPVAGFVTQQPAAIAAEPQREDVNLWYSLIGQKALTELITELNIRQCNQISIEPNGDVYFAVADDQPQKAKTLEQMPAPAHWGELKQLLEQQDLSVNIQDGRLSVAW